MCSSDLKSEDNERGEVEQHGAGGPLGVSNVRMNNPICEAYIAACVAAGIPATNDFNGAEQEGAGYYQLTTKDGRRSSTAVAYLKPAIARRNLTVITDANVDKLVVADGRVTGVTFNHAGTVKTINAGAEVLLTAGAIGGPQIKQVSGLGPVEVLRAD